MGFDVKSSIIKYLNKVAVFAFCFIRSDSERKTSIVPLDNFKVLASVCNGEVVGCIDAEGLPQGSEFYFYLLRYGVVVARTPSWISEGRCVFPVSKTGSYSVQGHVRVGGVNKLKKSPPVFYLSESDSLKYHEFLKEDCSSGSFELDLFGSEYPYQHFVVDIVFESTKESACVEFLGFDRRCFGFEGGTAVVFSSEGPVDVSEGVCFFSGAAASADGGELVYGRSGLRSLDSISESIGAYSYCFVDHAKNVLHISSDFFGVEKIYYAELEGRFVAANSYHALLMYVSRLDVCLTFDFEKVLANFAFFNLQPFHQNFSHEMEVLGCFVLPVDERICFENGAVFFRKTSLSDVCATAHSGADLDYSELLEKSRAEVVQNCRVLSESGVFNDLLVDLSGGLDSRSVYSALTNIRGVSAKVSARFNKAEPLDHVVANTLNGFYGFGYDDLPEEISFSKKKNPWSDFYSYYLGSYYSYLPTDAKRKILGGARYVGFYGEIAARPYYSRRFLGTDVDVDDDDLFLNSYFEDHLYLSHLASSKSLTCAKEVFSRQFKRLPGRSSLERFEFHYLYFRNGLHCSGRVRNGYYCFEWGPLQSKSLFLAKHAFFESHKGSKLQFDLLYALNPLLAKVPYQSEMDNQEKSRLAERSALIESGGPLAEARIDLKSDLSAWEVAAEVKSKNRVVVGSSAIQGEMRGFSEALHREALLYVLKTAPDLRKEIGPQLWYFWSHFSASEDQKSVYHNCMNRVVSLYYQSKLIGA